MEQELKNQFVLTGSLALAAAGLMAFGYLEQQDVLMDASPESHPVARNQYLITQFPQLKDAFDQLSISPHAPTRIWKEQKNEWHAVYQLANLGKCSELHENWGHSLASSFGQADRWGTVQEATSDKPIHIKVRSHPEYVHIFLTEYHPAHFADKPWYKPWRTSPSEIKSSYVMSINCDDRLKDRAP